jgi:hypothetical protein
VRDAAPLVLLLAIVMAGCGGDSTETETQVETKADFIVLGDVVCKNHQSRTEDLESQTVDVGPLDSKKKANEVADLLRRQADNLTAEAKELGALRPPSADERSVGSILAILRAKADVIRQWARAYDNHDAAEIRSVQERIAVATARARNAAGAYGFAVCGQG